MMGLALLCALSVLFGLFAGWACGPLSLVLMRWGRIARRVSYGGVERHCARDGGALLILALVLGLAPLALIGVLPWSALLGLLGAGIACLCAGAMSPSRRSRVRGILLRLSALLVLLVAPDGALLPALLLMVLGARLAAQIAGADCVPGVPAALTGPPVMAAGALLVLLQDRPEGLVALVLAGALVALQRWHRFPPRLVLGTGGACVLALALLATGWALMAAGNLWAVLLLGSFFVADLAHDIAAWREAPAEPPFEKARLRGEPEHGLAVATGTLACANVVMLCAVLRSGQPVQAAMAAFGLMLAFQFRRFLARGRVVAALRPPWHRDADAARLPREADALPSSEANRRA